MTTKKIDMMSPASGRMLGEDDGVINVADEIKGINTKLEAGGNLGGEPISETNPMPITSTDDGYGHIVATIAQGASQSGVIDLEGYQLAALHMPAAWDAADITLLAADVADGVYQPLYYAGQEVKEKVAASQCVAPENYIPLASVRFLKIRSGTSSAPVAQAATREIKITVKR